jgi:hypothetical protein
MSFPPITPERYAELLSGLGLSDAAVRQATYGYCAGCGLQGYEHHDRDCGAFTPAVDAEPTP